ncbi:LbtU family siderophore porin [Trichloromonas sp.]|uniref:LbtU family siderophore porin n=1 Tax=Trichloromonas sp. TaxID=3069249 RepID=UPI002A4A0C12|nr:LbtU family siderophore porin [Trichloromonas sp.]
MKIHLLLLTCLLLLTGIVPALADTPDARGEIENLKRRIAALEGRETEKDAPFTLETFGKYLRLHGLLELEAFTEQMEGGDETSDLTLATAQVELEVEVNENIGGNVVFLYEEAEGEDDTVEIDEAIIHLTHSVDALGGEIGIYGGKMYVPFGMFNSHFISDPLTLELGETNDTALYLDYQWGDWVEFKTGFFNGEVDTADDNNSIDSFVAAVEVTPAEGLSFGLSYISDLAESDGELVSGDLSGDSYRSSVAGGAAYLSASYGPFTFEAEYLAALEDFDRELVDANLALDEPSGLTGRRPQTWNLELALTPAEGWEVAVKAEQARDFMDDVRRHGIVVAHGIFRNTSLALEYLHSDGEGEDNDPTHTTTAQLAFEF